MAVPWGWAALVLILIISDCCRQKHVLSSFQVASRRAEPLVIDWVVYRYVVVGFLVFLLKRMLGDGVCSDGVCGVLVWFV